MFLTFFMFLLCSLLNISRVFWKRFLRYILPLQISPRHCYRTSTSAKWNIVHKSSCSVARDKKKRTKEKSSEKIIGKIVGRNWRNGEKMRKLCFHVGVHVASLSVLVSRSTKVLTKAQRAQTHAQTQCQSAFRHRADNTFVVTKWSVKFFTWLLSFWKISAFCNFWTKQRSSGWFETDVDCNFLMRSLEALPGHCKRPCCSAIPAKITSE